MNFFTNVIQRVQVGFQYLLKVLKSIVKFPVNIWKKIKPRWRAPVPPSAATSSPTDVQKTSFWSGWLLFATGLVVGGYFLLTNRVPLGLTLLGLDALYLASCLHEIKSPNIAFLFRMGKFVGMLEPGWYVTIPHFWDIEQIPTSWIQKDMKGDMYTHERTLICVHGRVKYRVRKDKLDHVLLMMPKEMESRAVVISMSSLRGSVGGSAFEKLVGDKGALEVEIDGLLKAEFEEHGYEYGDFKINDFDEQIQSEAKKIEILGEARGKAAQALATPLKDNLPAALANIASTIAESVGSIFGTRKPKKKEGEEKSEGSESTTDVLKELSENLKKLIGRT